MELLKKIEELIADYLTRNDIELVEMAYKRIQGEMTLRILVDTPNGIRMDQCESLNRYVGEVLDRENLIDEHYVIEVASPGLDRPLKSDRDFERRMGKVIEMTTYEPIDGKRAHEGVLIGMDKEHVVIEKEGISTVVPRCKIAVARLKLEF